jgi:hypothetical protein
MRQLLVVAAALAIAVVGVRAQAASSRSQSLAPQGNQPITVTGCLASGPNGTFTLTAAAAPAANTGEAPTGTTATTPAGSKVAKTITYTLAAGDSGELKSQVGHTVRVTGVETAPQAASTATDTRHTEGAQGTSGTAGTAAPSGKTPSVETTTQTQIVARQLTVSGVTSVSDRCDLIP